jgi:L-alanine-DL-glutamate epimerase-like enolase superfamily enzyme
LKITEVQAIHVRVEDPNIGLFDGSYDDCIIRIETDAGITGIAEIETLAGAAQGIVYARPAHSKARGLRELLVGLDPRDPAALWNLMYESTCYVGRRGLMMHAIGGVDIALWDIAAQAQGVPVHELLGGAKRNRLEAYGTIYPMAKTEQGVAEQVANAKTRLRLRNIKLAADPWWMDDLPLTAKLLRAARNALGDEGSLIVDAALAYRTAQEGLKLLPILRDVNVLFLEAPLPLDDIEGLARLAREGVPLGVGDLGLTHVDEFIEAMDLGGASICQPDITMVGGFTGIRKIAAAAAQRGKRVITHGYKSNIEIAANLHFLASHNDTELLEYSTSNSPLRWEMTLEHILVDRDGMVGVPQAPGLGVHLNHAAVERYRMPLVFPTEAFI